MKYLAFMECASEEVDVMTEKGKAIWAERETSPDKYPKKIFQDHYLLGELPKLEEGIRVVTIYETDDPEQMANLVAYWEAQKPGLKTMKRWLIPLTHRQDEEVASSGGRKEGTVTQGKEVKQQDEGEW